MSESSFEERRTGRTRDIETLVERQTEWVSKALLWDEARAEAFQRGMDYKVTADESLYCVFPGRIQANRQGTEHTVLVDQPTIDELVERFSSSHRVTETELTEMYVGTTIAAHLLKERIKDQVLIRKRRLGNMLVEPQSLFTAVRATDMFSTAQQSDLTQSLMQSNENRIGNINVLRFAFGIVYFEADAVNKQSGEVQAAASRESRVMRLFREGLSQSLGVKPVYQRLGQMISDQVEYCRSPELGDRVFADSVREFEIAACFPMNFAELHTITREFKK